MLAATILTIVVLNILLPTADVFTDFNLAVKLYKPPPRCRAGRYQLECLEDSVTFCSQDENKKQCKFYDPHYKMATALLMPFLLNYIVSFYTSLQDHPHHRPKHRPASAEVPHCPQHSHCRQTSGSVSSEASGHACKSMKKDQYGKGTGAGRKRVVKYIKRNILDQDNEFMLLLKRTGGFSIPPPLSPESNPSHFLRGGLGVTCPQLSGATGKQVTTRTYSPNLSPNTTRQL